ncbi:EF-hand domain-containing protein [Sphingomonas immobilis]|jgi:hypothetical protein|uniref:EF-hand domain-containing protein n=1 Tax=Sphingomonas immobilis TaxID=3063997 RepID=A0ABT8ZYE7_9SPHN|nr:EF-hand domain-containing protein [Sphingomonas sp. CA1-15]MDO7842603.1 EF-hand domain-containing protein [Sphingomonas sp. CA1-15]
MLKYVLLATAITVAAPAFAQDKPADPQTTPAAPAAAAPTAPAAPVQTTPVDPSAAAPAAAAPAPTAQAPADPAVAQAAPAQTTGQPASAATQVAAVVDNEFSTYDKNKDGTLDKAEFGAWMVALKSASDPSTKADAPATKTWVGQAFASADKDKSKSVSKTELTGFLSQGQS